MSKRKKGPASTTRPETKLAASTTISEKEASRWYDKTRVAIVISIAGFILSVFPAWYPIISTWRTQNFVGVVMPVRMRNDEVPPLKTGMMTTSGWERECISGLIYVEITNATSHRLGIQSFEVQEEDSFGKWETLPRPSLVFPFIVEWSAANQTTYEDFSTNYFDNFIVGKTLDSGESLQGWTFLSGTCAATNKPPTFAPQPLHWWWALETPWRRLINRSKGGGRLVIYDTFEGETTIGFVPHQPQQTLSIPNLISARNNPPWADAPLDMNQ